MTKQTSIRILGLLLCLAMAMGCFLVVSSAVPSAGTCGENLTWELADGVLTISGTGAMADYNCPSNAAPWYEERKSITSVVLQEGVTSIGSDAFLDCVNLRNITIPEGVASIGSYAFGDCYVLKSLTLPSSVKSIGGGAFMSCKKLNAITVPETSAYFCVIDGVLFNKDCTTILFVPAAKSGTYVIPETVTSIEDHAFDGCGNLTDIILPEGMTSIGYLAFQWCDSLTSITIPEGVTSIPSYAFNCCVRLRSITIPKSVTSIEHNAFLDCRSLKTVYYSGTQEQWDAIAIDSNNGCLTDAQIIVQEAEDPSVISGKSDLGAG